VAKEAEAHSYTFSNFHRARWNVMDLITIIAGKTIPASIFCDIDMEAAEELRKRLSSEEQRVTITAVILKAIAIAQISHPTTRSIRLPWGKIVTPEIPVAGFTVERMVGEQAAVFFGVIDQAQTKPLRQIACELSAYGSAPLDQMPQLKKEHLLSKFPWILRQIYVVVGENVPFLRRAINRGTFGVTSLGKFGATTIMAPNVCTSIFGVGTVEAQAVVVNDKIVTRKTMTICYAYDSLLVTNGRAVSFMQSIRALLESGLAGHLDASESGQPAQLIEMENTRLKADAA